MLKNYFAYRTAFHSQTIRRLRVAHIFSPNTQMALQLGKVKKLCCKRIHGL